eukprot:gnl/TRDRNA2_/TRDRNA2_174191_c7_seq2.p1 gnl/TRDRNA2_/TRDRNA2_174191_c7~~gnl/TRDRNA2_/TRDRNA2_174191_c7_seq2.p1  ORF type:complete len:151 (-),score=19.51 gnl/TRDRNA2_/TRDRNA2_174191_c7_seq2:39-491(-)
MARFISAAKGKGKAYNPSTIPGRNDHGTPGSPSAASSEQFFAALPEDSFSEEELVLRETLFEFLLNWEEDTLPTFAHAVQDPQIIQARQALLDAHGVSLKEWCERRMGEEISFKTTSSRPYPGAFELSGPSEEWLQQEREERGLKRLRTS